MGWSAFLFRSNLTVKPHPRPLLIQNTLYLLLYLKVFGLWTLSILVGKDRFSVWDWWTVRCSSCPVGGQAFSMLFMTRQVSKERLGEKIYKYAFCKFTSINTFYFCYMFEYLMRRVGAFNRKNNSMREKLLEFYVVCYWSFYIYWKGPHGGRNASTYNILYRQQIKTVLMKFIFVTLIVWRFDYKK